MNCDNCKIEYDRMELVMVEDKFYCKDCSKEAIKVFFSKIDANKTYRGDTK